MTRESKPLTHFTQHGIKLIPTFGNGATMGSWKEAENFTSDIQKIKSYWKARGIRRFQFHPADNGLICLDIDRKNGKDGLRELQRLLIEKTYMPRYVKALDYLSGKKRTWTTLDKGFPFGCWTETPSGGIHLYFKHIGRKYHSGEIAPGLEVVHYNHLITAPGSIKDSRRYIFFGSLESVRPLPPVLLQFMKAQDNNLSSITWEYKRREFGDLNLDQIAEIIERQGEHSPDISRNRYSYELAKFAQKQGYPISDVVEYIKDHLEEDDFPAAEIRQAVQSAYRR